MSNAMFSVSPWCSCAMPSPDTGTWSRASDCCPLREVLPWRHSCPSGARSGTGSQSVQPRTNIHRLRLPNVSLLSAPSSRRWFWLTEIAFLKTWRLPLLFFFYSVGSLTCGKSRWGEKKRSTENWDLIALELKEWCRLSLKQKSCRICCYF